MSTQNSIISNVINAITILNPKEPADMIDAKTLADLIDQTPEQVSCCLSKLYRANYLTKIGNSNRYNCFILKRPLPKNPRSVQRAYKKSLEREKQQKYRAISKQIASKIAKITSHAASREIEKYFTTHNRMANSHDQLPLFKNEYTKTKRQNDVLDI